MRWLGPGLGIHVGRIYIRDPLTYFADRRAGTYHEPAAVDLALAVASQPDATAQQDLPYWPRYDGLSPGQRRYYLEWLAGGRQNMPWSLGYVFLFIYGLERRALVGLTDQKLIFNEVLRLRRVYAANGQTISRSFDFYTTSFLWYLIARFPTAFDADDIKRLVDDAPLHIEEHVAAALHWFARSGTALLDWAAYAIADDMPQSQRSIVAQRVPGELRKLFFARFRECYPQGLAVEVSKRNRVFAYKPASAVLPHQQFSAPDPMGRPRQFEPLSDIWNQCIADLKKLSTLVSRHGDNALTAGGWEALPPELRAATDHPLTDAFCQLVETATDENGRCMPTAQQVAVALGWAEGDRYTPAQARKMCEMAGDIGYGLEPDARLTGRGYGGEERLVVFLRISDQQPDPVRYNAAAWMLRVGLAIAGADGQVHGDELAVLTQQIQLAFNLSEAELIRLEALRALLLLDPPTLSSVAKLTRGLSMEQRDAAARMIMAIVAADGVITADELQAVRSCYANMGFGQSEIALAIQKLKSKSVDVPADEPVQIMAAEPGIEAGEPIPQPPTQAPAGGLKLDRAAIAAIMMDTQEVAQMLAAAMNAQGAVEIEDNPQPLAAPDSPPAPAPLPSAPASDVPATLVVGQDVLHAMAAPAAVETADPTLPQRYAAFYQVLLSRGEWNIKEIDGLARQHGHMLSGAIEALNEWAFEKFGNPLFVEEADQLIVDKQIMN